jgi:hypothetical protein
MIGYSVKLVLLDFAMVSKSIEIFTCHKFLYNV